MNKKQIWVIVIIAVAMVSIVVYLKMAKIECNIKSDNSLNNVETSLEKDIVSVSSIVDKQTTKYAKINISYPKFEGTTSSFNKSIADFVNKSLVEFNSNAEENWKARVATRLPGENITEFPSEDEKFEFVSEWSLAQISNDTVSVLITTYQFSGGAHGSTVMKSYNYDVKNQKEITLSSLFKNEPNYLKRISDYSISNLKDQLSGNEMSNSESIEEGAGPQMENFEIFTISRNKITFYFSQYSIGPYALGIKTVDMYNWALE